MSSRHNYNTAIVIGAGGGLGTALVEQWQRDKRIDNIIAVSRQPEPAQNKISCSKTRWIQTDYTDASIARVCEQINELGCCITRICICNDILHSDNFWPEKRIEDLRTATMQQVFQINAVIPLLWLKSLMPCLKGGDQCVLSVFSARIGSIGDNHLGGWYAYRSSKAALNMALKTAAIEYGRRAKNVKLIAFHPGTTDTALSQPFHASVDKDSLLRPHYVAEQLVGIMNQQQFDGQLSFVDWKNKPIVW